MKCRRRADADQWVEELDCRSPMPAVDRVLLVHALEMSHDAEAMLREAWRVLPRVADFSP